MVKILASYELGRMSWINRALEILSGSKEDVRLLRQITRHLFDVVSSPALRWRVALAPFLLRGVDEYLAAAENYFQKTLTEFVPPEDLINAFLSSRETAVRKDSPDDEMDESDLRSVIAAFDRFRWEMPTHYQALVLLHALRLLMHIAPSELEPPDALREQVEQSIREIGADYAARVVRVCKLLESTSATSQDPTYVHILKELRDNLPNELDIFSPRLFCTVRDADGRLLIDVLRPIVHRIDAPENEFRRIFDAEISPILIALRDLDHEALGDKLSKSRITELLMLEQGIQCTISDWIDARDVKTRAESAYYLSDFTPKWRWNCDFLVNGSRDLSSGVRRGDTLSRRETESWSFLVNVHLFSGYESTLNTISSSQLIKDFVASIHGANADSVGHNYYALLSLRNLVYRLDPITNPLMLKAFLDLWIPAYFVGLASMTSDNAFGMLEHWTQRLRDTFSFMQDVTVERAREIYNAVRLAGSDHALTVAHIVHLWWIVKASEENTGEAKFVNEPLSKLCAQSPSERLVHLEYSPLHILALNALELARSANVQMDKRFLPAGWEPSKWGEVLLESAYQRTGVLVTPAFAASLKLNVAESVNLAGDTEKGRRKFEAEYKKITSRKDWKNLEEYVTRESLEFVKEITANGYRLIDAKKQFVTLPTHVEESLAADPKRIYRGDKGKLGQYERYLICRRVVFAMSRLAVDGPTLAPMIGYAKLTPDGGIKANDSGMRSFLTALGLGKFFEESLARPEREGGRIKTEEKKWLDKLPPV